MTHTITATIEVEFDVEATSESMARLQALEVLAATLGENNIEFFIEDGPNVIGNDG